MQRRAVLFILATVLGSGALSTFAQNASVSGTVTYLQRVALSPDAVVKVILEDVSVADAPAKVLSEREIPSNGKQVPISFELNYATTDIQPKHRYSVRAAIQSGNRLLFTSTKSYPVITNGAPSRVEMIMQPASTTSPVPGTSVAAPLEGTHWTLTKLGDQAIAPATVRIAYLQFIADGHRVVGSTGCNRLTGTYEQLGNKLKLRPIATTMMACIEPAMDQERKFNTSLGQIDSYRIRGNTLVLMGDKKVLASFEAAPADETNTNP